MNNLVRKAVFERLCCDSGCSIITLQARENTRDQLKRRAAEVSDLESLVEAKVTDICAIDRNH